MYAFIDLSYYTIHRYFAVLRWYKLNEKEVGDQAEVFARFDKSFEASLRTFQKKHKFEWANLYFARDTLRCTIWRNELFPMYKANRDVVKISNFDPAVFDHVYDELIPKLKATLGFGGVLYTLGAEADDVIAVAHEHLNALNDSQPIVILTNDHDYLQLLDENTTIVNANGEPISKKYDAQILKHILEYKIIRGDVSDNIPAIGKKIGEKTAYKLALDPALLAAKLASNADVMRQYELNTRLVSFKCIPVAIKSDIVKVLKSYLV